jgi:hypothetical protein
VHDRNERKVEKFCDFQERIAVRPPHEFLPDQADIDRLFCHSTCLLEPVNLTGASVSALRSLARKEEGSPRRHGRLPRDFAKETKKDVAMNVAKAAPKSEILFSDFQRF